jgi:hypothetical protein
MVHTVDDSINSNTQMVMRPTQDDDDDDDAYDDMIMIAIPSMGTHDLVIMI